MAVPGFIGTRRPVFPTDRQSARCRRATASEPESPGRPGRRGWPSERADVCWVALPSAESRLADHLAVLSDLERARAARFRFAADRIRSVVARASLRRLLGSYLGLDPIDVSFAEGPHGKPLLADERCTLSFNTAHSGGLVVHVVSECSVVGIDVERIRFEPLGEAMLGEFLTRAEASRLRRMPLAAAHREAHRLWTHKEAYLKALGTGLSVNPRQVELGIGDEPCGEFGARISHCKVDASTPCWSVWDLACPPGYVATLVRPGPPVPVRETVM